MIPVDVEQRFDHDCHDCKHRAERHVSKRATPSKPVRLNYVCLVCAKAVGESGCFTQHSEMGPFNYNKTKWVQDLPCKAYDKQAKKWFPLDWEPREGE